MSFVPTIEDSAAWFDVTTQRLDTSIKNPSFESDTSIFQSIEKLRVQADGYVYHPRFMVFYVTGSLGYNYGSADFFRNQTRVSQIFDEYNIDLLFVPEHPYNLELFARKQIPPMSPVAPFEQTLTSEGASFRYVYNPISFNANAIFYKLEGEQVVTDARSYSAGLSHFAGISSTTAQYSQTNASSTNGADSFTANSSIQNRLGTDRFTLTSQVSDQRISQTNMFNLMLDTSYFTWSEQFHLSLPYNFDFDYGHDYRKEDLEQQAWLSPQVDTFNRTTSDSGTIRNRLYNSLSTAFNAGKTSTESTTGDTDSTWNLLSFNYTKYIPVGNVQAGLFFQNMTNSYMGGASVPNEPHSSVQIGASFDLVYPGADPSTLSVNVRDSTTRVLVPMMAGVNYLVIQLGTIVRVQVLSVPASVTPAATFDFFVSYSLFNNRAEVDTRSQGYNMAFFLLDGLFNPYFSYVKSDQTVVSGIVPGGPDDTNIRIYGYTSQIVPFLFKYEFTDYESTHNPYRYWKASIEYRQAVFEDMDVYARLYYDSITRTNQSPTSFISYGLGYNQTNTTMSVTVHKFFSGENVDLFVNGNYTVLSATGFTTNSYTFNPAVRWHVGDLDVTLNVSKSYSVTDNLFVKQSNSQDSYFLTLSRKLL